MLIVELAASLSRQVRICFSPSVGHRRGGKSTRRGSRFHDRRLPQLEELCTPTQGQQRRGVGVPPGTRQDSTHGGLPTPPAWPHSKTRHTERASEIARTAPPPSDMNSTNPQYSSKRGWAGAPASASRYSPKGSSATKVRGPPYCGHKGAPQTHTDREH